MEYQQELASGKEWRTPNGNAEAATEDEPNFMPIGNPADVAELTQQLEQGIGANQTGCAPPQICWTCLIITVKRQCLESDLLTNETGTHLDVDYDHLALSNSARTSAAAHVCVQVGSGNAQCDIESLIAA